MKPLPDRVDQTLALAVDIQQIAAPTFDEAARAAFVRRQFEAAGLADVSADATGNVFALLPGAGSSRPVVVSAHLDTVFPSGTDLRAQVLPDRICAPGIGDNALGVAALVALAWLLPDSKSQLSGDVWLVANVGEEGLGDLCGMRAVVERFGDRPAAYLVLEGMGLGRIFHRGLGVRRYRVTAAAAGGHSWIDFGQPSAIHEIARLAGAITALSVPSKPRTSFNIGKISGGTSINTIAAHAAFELDLRSEQPEALERLIGAVLALVAQANRPGVVVSAEQIGSRPPGEIPGHHPLVSLARDVLREVGIPAVTGIGSTDANVPLSLGYPAICVGITQGSGAHTPGEFIFTRPLERGLEQLLRLIPRIWALPRP